MKTIHMLIAVVIILSNVLTCSAIDIRTFDETIKTFDKRPQGFPVELILLPNATAIRYYKLGGTYQLFYRVQADYPAKEAITAVSAELQQRNWRALAEDYLNPGIPSGHFRGWMSYNDTAKNPPQTVHQWQANWESKKGDIVTYNLFYQYDTSGTQDLKNMAVIVIFAPAAIAKKMREMATAPQKE